MRKLRRLMLMLSMCFALALVAMPAMSMTVYASEADAPETGEQGAFGEANDTGDTGSAVQDILRNERFQGALSSISKITDFIDIWFIRIISLVSFFIISAAMLKNACAGAYCANSKFWDKVADAHQKTEAINLAGVKNFFAGGQGIMNTSAGGIKDFLLGLVPNIKAFTDFEDADIEPKAYFMKAIPQMIACVVIGIFIYNGYYRDTAATVGEMGSVMIERTLNSVNPDSFINKIFNTTGWPKFPWDKDTSRAGKWRQAVAEELKSIVASNCTDITSSAQKADVITLIAKEVDHQMGDLSGYEEAVDGYMWNISGVSGYMSTSIGEESDNYEDENGNVIVKMVFPMRSIVPSSTAISLNSDAAYINFTLKRVVDDKSKGSTSVSVDGWGTSGSSSIVTVAGSPYTVSAATHGISASVVDNVVKYTFPSDVKIYLSDFYGGPVAKSVKASAQESYVGYISKEQCVFIKAGTTVEVSQSDPRIPVCKLSNAGTESEMCYITIGQ